MRKASWGTCVLGIAVLVVVGCTPDYFSLNYSQTTTSGSDQIVHGSVQRVSNSTKDSLEKLGMSVKADKQGTDIRLTARAKSGETFAVVFTQVQSDRGEQTRVRMESGTDAHKQIVFKLLTDIQVQPSR